MSSTDSRSGLSKYVKIFSRAGFISILPMVFQIIGRSADITGLITSAGFVLNSVIVLLVVGLNIYVQYVVVDSGPIEGVQERTAKQRIVRRAHEKKTARFLKVALILSLLATTISIVILGQLIYRYTEVVVIRNQVEQSRQVSDIDPLILPSFTDNVLFWEDYESMEIVDISELEEIDLIYQVVPDQTTVGNSLLSIQDRSDGYNPLIIFNFRNEYENGIFHVMSYKVKMLELESTSMLTDVYRQIADTLLDNQWHEVTIVTDLNGSIWRYIDGSFVTTVSIQSELTTGHAYATPGYTIINDHLLSSVAESYSSVDDLKTDNTRNSNSGDVFLLPVVGVTSQVILIDDVVIWETDRDVISEIENR